ncbi:hypothetical protein KAU39_03795 [bacterium]|nr:hypothetical protein [bacterium]
MMGDYKKITILENRNRTKLLVEFRKNVVNYFDNVEDADIGLGVYENEEAKQLRRTINMNLDRMYSLIILSGVKPVMCYSPPRAIGGFAGDIDLVINIFNLYEFQIDPQQLMDFIDRAIGIYSEDRLNALFRTINPFFWLCLILDYIVGLPFKIIGKIGFNQKKIETSIAGRIIKGVFYLITMLAAFLTVLEKTGYLEKFKSLIK